jgi:hypothetical protein
MARTAERYPFQFILTGHSPGRSGTSSRGSGVGPGRRLSVHQRDWAVAVIQRAVTGRTTQRVLDGCVPVSGDHEELCLLG